MNSESKKRVLFLSMYFPRIELYFEKYTLPDKLELEYLLFVFYLWSVWNKSNSLKIYGNDFHLCIFLFILCENLLKFIPTECNRIV